MKKKYGRQEHRGGRSQNLKAGICNLLLPYLLKYNNEEDTTYRTIGFGYDIVFGVTISQDLLGEFDELDWSEIFMELNRQFPKQHFDFQLGVDYGHQFPTIKDLADHLMGRLSWKEIRTIDLKYKAGDIGLGH